MILKSFNKQEYLKKSWLLCKQLQNKILEFVFLKKTEIVVDEIKNRKTNHVRKEIINRCILRVFCGHLFGCSFGQYS